MNTFCNDYKELIHVLHDQCESLDLSSNTKHLFK